MCKIRTLRNAYIYKKLNETSVPYSSFRAVRDQIFKKGIARAEAMVSCVGQLVRYAAPSWRLAAAQPSARTCPASSTGAGR
jgi:hypothetical protein